MGSKGFTVRHGNKPVFTAFGGAVAAVMAANLLSGAAADVQITDRATGALVAVLFPSQR